MRKITSFLRKYSFLLLILLLLGIIFHPTILKGEIPFSSNLLVSFFNPWAQEKFPGWDQGIPNKPVGIDDLRIFYPQRHFSQQALEKRILPLWNPYSFSGVYHAGLSETAIFYPLFYLFFLFPQLPTWVFLMILEPILVSIGMYLYLRLLMKEKASAIFGALTLGFSGLVIVRMVEGLSVGHTLVWAPFVLLGVEGFLQKKKWRYLYLLVAALCLTLLAGWFQFALYTIFLGILYGFIRFLFDNDKRKSLYIFIPFLLLPFLTLFHIIPALEALTVSSRGATTTQQLLHLHLMSWQHVLTYIFPDFWGNPGSYNFFGKSEYKESILYIGAIPFMLALFSLSVWKKQTPVIFFSILSIASFILGIDTPITRSILSLPIPIVSSFLPDRIFYFATIGLSVLSAYGFEKIAFSKKVSGVRILFVAMVVAGILFLANGYIYVIASANPLHAFLFLKNLHIISQTYQIAISKHNLIIPDLFVLGFFIVFLIGRVSKKSMIIGIFLLSMLSQVYFAQKYIPFSQPSFVFPKHEVFSYLQKNAGTNRFISTGNGYIPANISLFYNLYSPDGVGSMYIARYGQLVTFMQTKGQSYTSIPRIEIRIDPSSDDVLSGKNPYLLRFLQIDADKYIVKLKKDPATVDVNQFQKVWENNTWEIYVYKNVLPRVFWTNSFDVIPQNTVLLSKLFQKNGTSVVLEKAPGIKPGIGKGVVHIVSYEPNRIVLQTNTTSSGIVYIADNYTSQFQAAIDNQHAEVLRANYTFMAVAVPKGRHTLILSYADTKETIGFIIAGVTLLLVLGIGILIQKKMVYFDE